MQTPLTDRGGRLIITMIPPFVSSVWHRVRFPWDADQKDADETREVYGMTRGQIKRFAPAPGLSWRTWKSS